jgi:hypothetical protein
MRRRFGGAFAGEPQPFFTGGAIVVLLFNPPETRTFLARPVI